MKNKKYQLHELKNIPAKTFLMTPLELREFIDFDVKRIYFLKDPKDTKKTGSHCHTDDESELFVMIQGKATAVLDDGTGKEEIELVGPKHALYVPRLVWHHFKNMSDDAIILALTSTNYDPERGGYCEDYQEFQELFKK